ncbi:MAG: hypothetical protein IJH50_04140 [Kiritimatiellae bacterium]|nr:hypothetical protein [Kiritimatiellia bacterium]
MNKTNFWAVLALLPISVSAAHISETMTLMNGWNAIYLESTPTNAVCEEFFAGAPVARVASYHSDAYSSTRQLADDGTEIAQKPISYCVWLPGDETASTMSALVGGNVYLIYATNAWSKTFLGVPAAPQQTYRATSGNTGFMNLVGVSAEPDVSVAAKKYFGEGPFGTASGVAYQIGGSNTAAPTFLPMVLGATSKLQGGKAYALTATKDGDWPGVIGFLGSASVDFGSGDFASVTLKNFGTTNHTFSVKIVASADTENEKFLYSTDSKSLLKRKVKDEKGDESWSNVTENVSWDVALAAGASSVQKFAIDRIGMEAGKTYAAVMQIEDRGETQMRVRIPVTVGEKPAAEAAFPTGLWAGYIQMENVSSLTNTTPTAAAGTLKMNILVHVPANGTPQLLQRVAAGVDSAGNMRLFKELSSAKTVCENPRRLSSVMMSVANPIVDASAHTTFGDQLQFAWTVDANARDNPFRHAWHPDHDGKTADYSGDVVSGDDLANYVNPVKPELWSVTNTLYLSWHKRNIATEDIDFEHNPNETTAGFATWTVGGLISNGPISSMGIFYLKRIADVGEVED